MEEITLKNHTTVDRRYFTLGDDASGHTDE